MRHATALTLCLVVAASCGDALTVAPNGGPARFAVRGRWPDPSHITVLVEKGKSPIGDLAFARAVERAMKGWNDTGQVGFAFASGDEPVDVTLGWRSGRHDACEPFGTSADIAHTGPPTFGTYVHFDLARSWSEQGPEGLSVFHTALHELGHVLGLGHTDAPGAVMSTDVLRPAVLSRHEVAAIHSLYGGGSDGEGDLQVVGADGSVAATLREVAPPSCCAFSVFDCDGDGRDEVLVWRTDAAGYGALTLYFFDSVASLLRTFGPFYGVVAPGARVGFVVTPEGDRLLVNTFSATHCVLRQFGELGIPTLPNVAPPPDLLALATIRNRADFDGDGNADFTVRNAPP